MAEITTHNTLEISATIIGKAKTAGGSELRIVPIEESRKRVTGDTIYMEGSSEAVDKLTDYMLGQERLVYVESLKETDIYAVIHEDRVSGVMHISKDENGSHYQTSFAPFGAPGGPIWGAPLDESELKNLLSKCKIDERFDLSLGVPNQFVDIKALPLRLLEEITAMQSLVAR